MGIKINDWNDIDYSDDIDEGKESQCPQNFLLLSVPLFPKQAKESANYYFNSLNSSRMTIVKILTTYWRSLVVLLLPMLLLPFPLHVNSQEGYCAYMLLLMAVFWILECIPIPVTGMIPMILLPIMEIQSSEEIVGQYIKDSSMVFLGGMLIALAFEYSNIHRRIALRVMLWTGASTPRLLLGIMLTTMTLSMWIFNVSAAAMMVPIVLAVVDELHKSLNNANSSGKDKEITEAIEDIRTMFLLGICYSSNLGGTGVVTGTSTNMIGMEFLGGLDPKQYGEYSSLTFTSWMVFAIVPMILNTFVGWVYLQLYFLGIPTKLKIWKKNQESVTLFTPEAEGRMKEMLLRKYSELGDITTHEIALATLFASAIVLWIFHDPKVIPGWSNLFDKKVSISTGTLLISVLLFVIPRDPEFYSAFKTGDFTKWEFHPLLDWNFAQSKIPFGLVFLLVGGGYALSSATKKTGLSSRIAESLKSLSGMPPALIQLLCLLFIAFMTEVASNSATATILVPILLDLSKDLEIHPLYLTLPATIASSFAFMLPIATATNALIYSFEGANLKLSTMIKAGFLMNIFSVLVLCLCSNFYGEVLFHFSSYKH